MVERLNALATSGREPFFWQPVWVARADQETRVVLTPEDRDHLELARGHGALGTERPVGVFFSFFFNLAGARAASDELRSLGWPDVGIAEELSGDECWHVYGHGRRLVLDGESIVRLRADMEDVAERLGGRFDGWDVSGGRGLRWAEPGELPT
jgi:hypothetical protein